MDRPACSPRFLSTREMAELCWRVCGEGLCRPCPGPSPSAPHPELPSAFKEKAAGTILADLVVSPPLGSAPLGGRPQQLRSHTQRPQPPGLLQLHRAVHCVSLSLSLSCHLRPHLLAHSADGVPEGGVNADQSVTHFTSLCLSIGADLRHSHSCSRSRPPEPTRCGASTSASPRPWAAVQSTQ